MKSSLAAFLLVATALPAGYYETKFFAESELVTPITLINLAIGVGILIAWYLSDAKARKRQPAASEGFLIGGLPIVGVPLYLFSTRPRLEAILDCIFAGLIAYTMIRAWDLGAALATF